MQSLKRVFGYARVSSKDQKLDRQIITLKKYVPNENIIVDKASGKDFENRPGYMALKGALGLRAGDVLYIVSLDRLSRNKNDIKTELEWFKKNKITLRIIDIPTSMMDFPEGQEWIADLVFNILVEVLASMAEQERNMIRKRQAEGIKAAKDRGKYLGRPKIIVPDNFECVYARWKANEITAVDAMNILNLKKGTFYKMAKQYEEEHRS